MALIVNKKQNLIGGSYDVEFIAGYASRSGYSYYGYSKYPQFPFGSVKKDKYGIMNIYWETLNKALKISGDNEIFEGMWYLFIELNDVPYTLQLSMTSYPTEYYIYKNTSPFVVGEKYRFKIIGTAPYK